MTLESHDTNDFSEGCHSSEKPVSMNHEILIAYFVAYDQGNPSYPPKATPPRNKVLIKPY